MLALRKTGWLAILENRLDKSETLFRKPVIPIGKSVIPIKKNRLVRGVRRTGSFKVKADLDVEKVDSKNMEIFRNKSGIDF